MPLLHIKQTKHNNMTQIPTFLSIPIQGVRENEKVYKTIMNILSNLNYNVVNKKEISEVPSKSDFSSLNAFDIYRHDIELLKKSEVFIAEISNPSLGVGYEICEAEKRKLPIVYIYNSNYKSNVSLMILGSPYKYRKSLEYNNIEELKKNLPNLLQKLISTEENKTRNKISDHFNNKFHSYDYEVNWRKDEKILYWFREVINRRKTCLDLGTGTGIIGGEIKKNGIIVTGVDISLKMLEKAKNNIDIAVHSDITELPFPNEQFDAVTIRQVLHYIKDENKCLTEAYRVLKKGGILACAHVTSSLFETANWWRTLKKLTQPLREKYFVTNELKNIIIQNGFKLIDESSYFLEREDNWDTFIVNVNDSKDIDELKKHLILTSDYIKDKIKLQVTDDSIKYNQEWSLTLFQKP